MVSLVHKKAADKGLSSDTLVVQTSGAISGIFGNYHTASDVRLKKEIVTIPDALKKVLALHGVNYRWKDGSDNGSLQMGMIAQEVEEVVPEVVYTANDGMKTKAIEYQYLVGLLVEATKELKAENDAEIATLKTENKQLKETLTAMADRQKSIEDMLLALSATPSKEKLVKLDKHKHIFKPITDKIRNSKIDVNQ